MHEINKYFKLYDGQQARLSEMKSAKPAIEVLTSEGLLIQQKMLWENDWMVIPNKSIIKSDVLDDGRDLP